jgi:hypothetical protein
MAVGELWVSLRELWCEAVGSCLKLSEAVAAGGLLGPAQSKLLFAADNEQRRGTAEEWGKQARVEPGLGMHLEWKPWWILKLSRTAIRS